MSMSPIEGAARRVLAREPAAHGLRWPVAELIRGRVQFAEFRVAARRETGPTIQRVAFPDR